LAKAKGVLQNERGRGPLPKLWNKSSKTWSEYCQDIGHSRQVVNHWLRQWEEISGTLEAGKMAAGDGAAGLGGEKKIRREFETGTTPHPPLTRHWSNDVGRSGMRVNPSLFRG